MKFPAPLDSALEFMSARGGTALATPRPTREPATSAAGLSERSPAGLGRDALHRARILIIDDEEPNVRLLERILARANFENFVGITDSREVAAIFKDFQPDLVLTDWLMPHFNGLSVILQLNSLIASDDYLPVLVLTADVTSPTKQQALAAGATDFLTKPFDQVEVLLRIRNLLQARLAHLKIQEQNAALEENVRQRTHELERTLGELRTTQGQVIQQERLAALGAMAGGIAHDFNNSLCAILGFTELLIRDVEHGLTKAQAAEPLATILTAAEDAAKIVQRLRGFYRPEESGGPVRLPVNLNTLIEQAVTLTQPKWQTQAIAAGAEIRVNVKLGEIPTVVGDAAELREMLTNLIFNAVDALPQGGVITLSTRVAAGEVLLQIRDTGVGMSEDVRRRCLEPFFTTKGDRGTGLGLAMVFGIMQRHSGSVEIESAPSCGTTFSLRLPAGGAAAAVGSSVADAVSRPLRILVVDDQPMLCQLLNDCLKTDLHTVEMATSGPEALEKFRAGNFDLVITDQVMAGMNGLQLAVALKALRPKLPIILLTGFSAGNATSAPRPTAIDLVVGKPLSLSDLRRALVQVTAS